MDDLQHHILNTYLVNTRFDLNKLENINNPLALTINNIAVNVSKGKVESYINELMEKYSINRQMAITLSNQTTIGARTVEKIKTVYDYLGEADFYYSEVIYRLVTKLPFMRTNILKLLRGDEVCGELVYINKTTDAILKFIENCKYLGIEIDIDYWDFQLTVDENTLRLGVSQGVINRAAIAKLNSLAAIPEFMEHYTSLKHLNNINCGDFLKVSNLTDGDIDDGTLVYIFGKYIGKTLKINFSVLLPWKYKIEAVRMFIWILEYKQWYDSETRIWSPAEMRYIALNNHTFVDSALKQVFKNGVKNIPNPPDKYTHPKDYLERFQKVALMEYIESKGGIKSFEKMEIFSELGDSWRWISNNLELINEGELQHHCCGGSGYIASCMAGVSVFFRYGGENGYTVEVKHSQSKAAYELQSDYNPITTLEALVSIPLSHKSSDGKTFTFVLNCVEGKYRRKPSDSTLFKIWLDLVKLSNVDDLLATLTVQLNKMTKPMSVLEFIKSIPEDVYEYRNFITEIGLVKPSSPPTPRNHHVRILEGMCSAIGRAVYDAPSKTSYSLADMLKGKTLTQETSHPIKGKLKLFLGKAKQPRMIKLMRFSKRMYPSLGRIDCDEIVKSLSFKKRNLFDPLQLPVVDYSLNDSDRNLLITLICSRLSDSNIFDCVGGVKALPYVAAMLVNKVCFGYLSLNELLSIYLATTNKDYLFGESWLSRVDSMGSWFSTAISYLDEKHCSNSPEFMYPRILRSHRVNISNSCGIDSLLGQELIGRKLFNDFDYYLDNMFSEYQSPKNPASKLNVSDYPSWVFYKPNEKYLPKAFNGISRKTDKGEDSDNFKFTVKEGGRRHWTSFNSNQF